jgi:KUP system potassium uptake protein
LRSPEPTRKELLRTALTALGVVFGDIGTSPLYAFRECFHGPHAVPATASNVLGILSLILWSLIVVISVKYLGFVMRADNRGEGGILALMALALRGRKREFVRNSIVVLGLFGAALLYGDGVITPAISVLSAVEGLQVATPLFSPYVIPITLVILVLLFLVQRTGTARVGTIFGPVTLLWFLCIGGLGIHGVLMEPHVLKAISPLYAVHFFREHGLHGATVLGAVFLVVTGGEALYADMGHFGRKPIRYVWFALVLPALVLNYFGQGALLLSQPQAAENPFYRLAPEWMLLPLVVLATAAAVIASQALISGAFSVTRQAVQLGYSPRFEIIHTSAKEIGQIYIPVVNWILLAGVCALVLGFGASSKLAAAYGIAVTMTMLITTLLVFFVSRRRWRWSLLASLSFCLFFLLIDASFAGANFLKFAQGGWFPVLVALAIFTLMTTWKRGRLILADRLRTQIFPLDLFLKGLSSTMPTRVPGVAVFMSGNSDGTPPALMHNLKHNKVLHQTILLLTVTTAEIPHVDEDDQLTVERLDHGFFKVVARYGFMETPDVPKVLQKLRKEHNLQLPMMETTFFLGRETLIPTKRRGMALWREALFAWMSRNAQPATAFFNLPPNRVVELGSQVEL